MTTRPLIIFDSGVGGFSILREIISHNYSGSIVYFADQKNLPYGEKSSTWIKNRLTSIANWSIAHDPIAFVLACNTATVSGVEQIRSILSCPVVAVEPVTKPLSQYSHPLLLATSTTLQSFDTHDTITACPKGLVQAIEDMAKAKAKKTLTLLNSTIRDNNIDAIGLSCTHYPLVRDVFVELYPDIKIIDPSIAVVKHLFSLINSPQSSKSELSFYTTANPTTLTNQVKYYLNLDVVAKGIKT